MTNIITLLKRVHLRREERYGTYKFFVTFQLISERLRSMDVAWEWLRDSGLCVGSQLRHVTMQRLRTCSMPFKPEMDFSDILYSLRHPPDPDPKSDSEAVRGPPHSASTCRMNEILIGDLAAYLVEKTHSQA
jgi:hypothetical protein